MGEPVRWGEGGFDRLAGMRSGGRGLGEARER